MNSAFEEGSNRRVLLIFLAIALCACYWLVKPFLEPIILAILIGMLAFPAHNWLVAKLNGRQSSAALLSCLVLAMVFLIPALFLLVAILKQGVTYSVVAREWATGDNIRELLSHPWMLKIKSFLEEVLPPSAFDHDERPESGTPRRSRRLESSSSPRGGSGDSRDFGFIGPAAPRRHPAQA